MHRNALAVAGVLVVGLVGAGYVVDRASGQVTASSRPDFTWPPPPQNMVDRQGSSTVNGQSYETIFDVPSGYWFVMTDYHSWNNGSSSAYFPFTFQLGEDLGGTFTTRMDFWKMQWSTIGTGTGEVRFQSATGIAFHPGSKVRLFNVNLLGTYSLSWSFVGYLVPK
jgi:hypothetical protein